MKPRVPTPRIPIPVKSLDHPASPSGARSVGSRFYRNHLLLPLGAAFALSVVLLVLEGDFWIADRLYAWEGHAWSLKSHPLLEPVIHTGGRMASLVAWLLVAGAYAWSCFDARFVRWRRALAYLALTTLLATTVVSALKAATGMDCPWDLARYGGDQAYVGLFDHRPATMPAAACFPAAHASAGYAWVTLYFFFLVTRPRFRWAGLSFALAVGATFGFAQQLRGAHFLSHDLWTLVTCWLAALGGYLCFFGYSSRDPKPSKVALPAPTAAGQ